MTTPEEDKKLAGLTKELRRQTRRQEELNNQRKLFQGIPMLSLEDTIRVLKDDTEGALILIDTDTATVKVPAFPFLDESGEVKRNEVTDVPIANPKVLAVFRQQMPGFGLPSKLDADNAWFMLVWWVTDMRLDVSDPESRPFRPIDVTRDPRMLDELVDWFKDLDDESYG